MFLLLATINPYLAVLLDNLAQVTVFLLLPIVAALAFKVVKHLEKKFGIDVDDKYEAKLQELAQAGVLRAGEWARTKVKLGEQAPAGAQKLQTALEFVKGELDRQGYDEIAEEKLKALIEAMVAKQKAASVVTAQHLATAPVDPT